jgi:hypothetical protein
VLGVIASMVLLLSLKMSTLWLNGTESNARLMDEHLSDRVVELWWAM